MGRSWSRAGTSSKVVVLLSVALVVLAFLAVRLSPFLKPDTSLFNLTMPVPPWQLAGLAIALLSSSTSAIPLSGTSLNGTSFNATSTVSAALSPAYATPSATYPSEKVSISVSIQRVTVTVTAPSTPSATSGGPDEFPAVKVRGEGAWADAVGRAEQFISNWTLEQLVNVTTGVGWQTDVCVGNIASQPELGFPGLCLQDAPSGVRFADFVSVFPAGINAASTFDRKLMHARGVAMGEEFRDKGVNIALGPAIGLGRQAQGGRNWESFGGDPYLVGEAAYDTVLGMQTTGVQACAKHLIANEEEHNRTRSSSNLDDRTMHEIYLHPFLKAVQAEVATVMCSYNLINNTYACENSKLQNDLLKRELGFQGVILSDWQATMSGIPSALGGLDMTMPGDITFNSGDSHFGANLTAAVNNGDVPLERVKDMVTRIVAAWIFAKQDESSFPRRPNFSSWNPLGAGEHIDVRANHSRIIREVGAASTVLLKNDGALPLSSNLRSIALIGNDAGPGSRGPNGFADRGGLDGVLGIGWGSGTAEYTYLVSPLEAIQAYAIENRQFISWTLDNWNLASVNSTAANKDVAIVFIASDSGEQYITVDGNEGDRNNLTAWDNGDAVVLAAAANNNNTIVVIHSVGPIIMESWIDHPNVTAVIYAGLPGQEAGNALLDVLSGGYNPSGRLPFTIAKDPADYPTSIPFYPPSEEFVQIEYDEKLAIDYRWFQSQNIEPRFGFGFGLSYSDFTFSNLAVSELPWSKRHLDDQRRNNWNESTPATNGSTPANDVGSSLAEWLHAPRVVVEFDVTNESDFVGSEVPQVYLAFPKSAGEPPKVLRGFERVKLEGGETTHVKIELSMYDLSYWDVVTQSWTRPDGEFTVYVGKHAFDDKSLTGTF